MENLENLLDKLSSKTYITAIMLTVAIISTATLLGLNITGLNIVINNNPMSMQSIFWHNMFISVLLILSIFTIGIVSNVLLAYNFFVFGIKIRSLLEQYDLDMLFHKVLLHGFFEIPQMILTGAIGSYFLVKKLTKSPIKVDHKLLILIFKVFVVAIILNVIAAYIESNFSMK